MKLSVIIVNYNVKHYIAQCVDSVFCALGGSGILAYIIAAIIIPRRPEY